MNYFPKIIASISLFFVLLSSADNNLFCQNISGFKLGNEVLISDNIDYIKNKNVALVTNASGILSNGTSLLDTLLSLGISVKKIFSPEHGFLINNNNEEDYSGIKIISLYGNTTKPSGEDLENIDVIIYDIQDVATRFYTYTSTLYYCIQASYENNKTFVICDRPVIANPDYVDGFLTEDDCKSFVGLFEIPVYYGMTCGELANYINGEFFNNVCNIDVIKMGNYFRSVNYSDLNLDWQKPSPSMYFPSTAVVYPGTCLLEGTNVSEGRGTEKPFEYIGSPFCDSELLLQEMNSYNFNGVAFHIISFTPSDIPGVKDKPKYYKEKCNGIFIEITDYRKAEPFKIGIALIKALNNNFKEFRWKADFFDKLAGTKKLREMIKRNYSLMDILNNYSINLSGFKLLRDKYLLYM